MRVKNAGLILLASPLPQNIDAKPPEPLKDPTWEAAFAAVASAVGQFAVKLFTITCCRLVTTQEQWVQ